MSNQEFKPTGLKSSFFEYLNSKLIDQIKINILIKYIAL